MAPETESPYLGIEASIPIGYYIAASNDKGLRRLIRAKTRALRKVQQALREEEEADLAILAYVQNTYPAPQSAEAGAA